MSAKAQAYFCSWGSRAFYAIFNSGEAWVLACENPSALSTMLPINSW